MATQDAAVGVSANAGFHGSAPLENFGQVEPVLNELGNWSGAAFALLVDTMHPTSSLLQTLTVTTSSALIHIARRPPSSTLQELDPFTPSEIEQIVKDALASWFRASTRFRALSFIRLYATSAALPGERLLLRVQAIVPNISLHCQRVPSLPILSTPLSRHLHAQSFGGGTTQNQLYGLLTLNETRKAVPLLEDDPLAYRVPVVGVWMLVESARASSEDAFVELALGDPSVWAGCVRFACNEYLQEKVCPEDSPTTFLVCLYPPAGSPLIQPVFIECTPTLLSGQLLTCFEAKAEVDVGQSASPDCALRFAPPTGLDERLEFSAALDKASSPEMMRWLRSRSSSAPFAPALPPAFGHALARLAEAPKPPSLSPPPQEDEPLTDSGFDPVHHLPTSRDATQVIAAQQRQIAQLTAQVAVLQALVTNFYAGPQSGAAAATLSPAPAASLAASSNDDATASSDDVSEIERRYFDSVI